jgi:hypothetical protein
MIADLFECCFIDFVPRCNNNNVVEAKNKSCSMKCNKRRFLGSFQCSLLLSENQNPRSSSFMGAAAAFDG